MRHARAHLDRIAPATALSLYSGVIGIDYASIAVGEAIHDEALITTAIANLESASRLLRGSTELDVVSGVASGIPALLSVYRRYPRPALLELAVALGENLLGRAVRIDDDTSWSNVAMSRAHNLTGFSSDAPPGFALGGTRQ